MTDTLGNGEGDSTEAQVRLYEKWSEGGTALSIIGEVQVDLKWSGFLGQVCGLAKMHRVCVHAAFRVSACWKYALSGVLLSRAV